MANTLKISVDNADELLLAGVYGSGALIQIQSSATEAGAFADLTGTGSTPTIALVAGSFIYTGQDPAGTSTTWYRTRFKNAAGSLTSDWTDPFQVSAEGSGLLASLHDAKQRLDIAYTDTGQDENLIEWLTQITAFVESYCGRQLTPDATTEYLADGYAAVADGRCLLFPHGIQSLTTLEVANGTGAAFTATTDYFLRPIKPTPGWPYTQVWISDVGTTGAFADGFANIRLTGTFGFAKVPDDIRNVALNLLVAYARERGAGGGDTITIGIGGERTYERALSMSDRHTLDRYRIRWVA